MTTSQDDQKERHRQELSEFNFRYACFISSLETILKQKSPVVASAVETQLRSKNSVDIKLPRLDLPKFDGQAINWASFRDQFKTTIHNREGLEKVSKFQYLKSCITDPHSPIQHLQITEEGYENAWKLVLERYEDKRFIVDSHLHALLTAKKMTCEDYEQLVSLDDTFLLNISALERKYNGEQLFNAIIGHMVIFRLDNRTQDLVETDRKGEILSWPEINELLQKRIKVLKALPKTKITVQKPINSSKPNDLRQSKSLVSTGKAQCPLCKGSHWLYSCSDFIKLSVADRNAKVKEKNLCYNCLGPHQMSDCKSTATCKECRKKHHSLLHRNFTRISTPLDDSESKTQSLLKLQNLQNTPSRGQLSIVNANASNLNPITESVQPQHAQCSASTSSHESVTLLSTAIVRLQDAHGQWHDARALLDSGSDSNFITKNVAQALRIKQKNFYVQTSGLGAKSTIINRKLTATMSSRITQDSYEADFLITPHITGNIPARPISVNSSLIPSSLQLADPSFNTPGKIDLLIGNDLFWQLMRTQRISIESGLTLIDSKLGWIVAGSVTRSNVVTTAQCHHSTLNDLRDSMERFYKLEDYRNDERFLTDEEQHCEELFEPTHQRDKDRRFIVTIPFKKNVEKLVSNNGQAYHQFLALEKRLSKTERLKEEYTKFIEEDEQLGHMEQIDPSNYNNETKFYFPHHAVEKPESSTTKVRVVFNGSSKTSSGLSLNDVQCIGPQIQSDGLTLAFKFRLHPIVIIADIAKMYPMIEVQPSQRHYQLIFWRKNPNEPVKTYELKTVTYGTSSASFQSTRCLKQLAIEARNEFPEAAAEIENGFYIDDYISGSDTTEQAIKLFEDVDNIISIGAMNLRKVFSNDKTFLDSIPEEKRESLKSDDMTIKALGIKWRPATDEIEFDVKYIDTSKVTKRIVLSEIAKLYDPQGLIDTSWDQSPPDELSEAWIKFAATMPLLNNIRIKRHFLIANSSKVELHGFSDASDKGYAAAVYVRSIDDYGNVETHIICAKSRIVPKERRSTPRLELCGAVILANTMKLVEKALKLSIAKKVCWSDSAIVLHWLNKDPSQLQAFVANRISEIQQMSNDTTWKHIPGTLNPADLISRGLTPEEIVDNNFWWHGPSFLSLDEQHWPESIVQFDPETPEFKAEFKKFQTLAVSQKLPNFIIQLVNDSSSLYRSIRTVANVKRFIFNARARAIQQIKRSEPITVDELHQAELTISRSFQSEYFRTEFDDLSKGKRVALSSSIMNLDPFWDSVESVIRVGGRLRYALHLSEDHKHPIIVPKSRLSLLIARQAHECNMPASDHRHNQDEILAH